MYEFEFWDEEHQEYVYLYGYSIADLQKRYPDEPISLYKLTMKEYID